MRAWVLGSCGLSMAVALACGDSTVVENNSGGASSSASSGSSSSNGGSGGGTTTSSAGGSGGGGGSGGSGGGTAGQWRADAWPGGLDHIVISYMDTLNNRCVRIQADAPTTGTLNITIPNPWGVSNITAWASTANCLDWQSTPPGPSASADTATGSINFTVASMAIYPCDLDVDVVANFNSPPPWLAPSVTLQTSMLKVEGACP